MLDRLPASVRHFLIGLAVAVVTGLATYAQANQDAVLSALPAWLIPIATPALASVLLWVTSLTRQYGVGAPDPTVAESVDTGALPPAA